MEQLSHLVETSNKAHRRGRSCVTYNSPAHALIECLALAVALQKETSGGLQLLYAAGSCYLLELVTRAYHSL